MCTSSISVFVSVRGAENVDLLPKTKQEGSAMGTFATRDNAARVHPAWARLMSYCAELGHGEIDKLKIQDGLPMTAEITTRKVKFIPG